MIFKLKVCFCPIGSHVKLNTGPMGKLWADFWESKHQPNIFFKTYLENTSQKAPNAGCALSHNAFLFLTTHPNV